MQSENTQAIEPAIPVTPETPGSVSPAAPTSLFQLLEEPVIVPGGESEKPAVPDTGTTPNETAAKPEMFNDLAEAAGLELNDLYALKVTTKDGETVSIEDLKSLHATQEDIVIRELEFAESKATQEGALRQAQNEIAEIVSALPEGTLQPAMLEKLRAKNSQRVEVEQRKTLDAIPAWTDETVRASELTGMAEHLQGFGYPSDYLGTIIDHRQLLFVRESYLREQRIKSALSRVRVAAPNPTTPTRAGGTPPSPATPDARRSNARNGLESFFSDL